MKLLNQHFLLSVSCLIFLAIGGNSHGSPLSDLANQMAVGTWAPLSTTGFDNNLLKTGSTDYVLNYGNSAVWDPINKEVRYMGKGHQESTRMIIYSESTNSWARGPTTVSSPHGYDHNAINPATGAQYYFGGQVFMRKYENGSWSNLPNLTGTQYSWPIALGIEYFPEVDKLFLVSNNRLVWLDNGSWSNVPGLSSISTGGYHLVAEYSPADKVIYYGGGNGEKTLYRLDADLNQTAIADAPIPIAVNSSIVSVDPVSGDILLVGRDQTAWNYRPSTDDWVPWDDVPIFTPQWNNKISFTLAVPIADYGVTMYLSRVHGVYLYKHAALAVTEPPGDFDGDFDVDGADFLQWQRGESQSPLNLADFDAWEANFGTVDNSLATSSTTVPEPSTLLLFGLATGLALSFSSKRALSPAP